MDVGKIFNTLMSFTLKDLPSNEVELTRFRATLERLRASAVRDDVQSEMDDRLYAELVDMKVESFPKTLTQQMEFNGNLLKLAFGR